MPYTSLRMEGLDQVFPPAVANISIFIVAMLCTCKVIVTLFFLLFCSVPYVFVFIVLLVLARCDA